MSDVLGDLSAPALVAAIKANPVEWWRYLGSSPKAAFYDSPQLAWLRTGISNSFVNCVLRAQLEPDDVGTIIEETVELFQNVAAMSWWTEPGTQPADLGDYLLARGLAYACGGPGMAVDSLELNQELPTCETAIQPSKGPERLRSCSTPYRPLPPVLQHGQNRRRHPQAACREWPQQAPE